MASEHTKRSGTSQSESRVIKGEPFEIGVPISDDISGLGLRPVVAEREVEAGAHAPRFTFEEEDVIEVMLDGGWYQCMEGTYKEMKGGEVIFSQARNGFVIGSGGLEASGGETWVVTHSRHIQALRYSQMVEES